MIRVRTLWSGVAGAPLYTNHHFLGLLDASTAAAAVANVEDFWNALEPSISSAFTYVIEGDVYEIAEASGEPTGVEVVTSVTGGGTNAGDGLPHANQGLISWSTGVFIAGRQLVGRTNVPGPTESSSNALGVPLGPYVDALNAAAVAMLASAPSLAVYSRTAGVAHAVIGGTGRDYFAILRSRRD